MTVTNTEGIEGHAGADAPLQRAVARLFQRARDLMMSMLISLGSVAWSSTWMPSSSLLNRSLELAYSILLLTLDVSGALHESLRQKHTPIQCSSFLFSRLNLVSVHASHIEIYILPTKVACLNFLHNHAQESNDLWPMHSIKDLRKIKIYMELPVACKYLFWTHAAKLPVSTKSSRGEKVMAASAWMLESLTYKSLLDIWEFLEMLNFSFLRCLALTW